MYNPLLNFLKEMKKGETFALADINGLTIFECKGTENYPNYKIKPEYIWMDEAGKIDNLQKLYKKNE